MARPQLAALVGVHLRTIESWEGDVNVPGGPNLTKLAEVLGTTPGYIIDGVSPGEPVLVLGACSDGTGPEGGLEGSYAMESVNGQRLPFDFPNYRLVSADLTLEDGGRYTGRSSAVRAGQPESSTNTGTFTTAGSSIRFTSSDGAVQQGTFAGETISVQDGAYLALYRRD